MDWKGHKDMEWQKHKDKLTDGEAAVLQELDNHGFLVSYWPDRKERFFVGAGSHGGAARSLRKAMKKCMACCEIYKFWRNDFGEGEHSSTFFQRLMNQHLGGLK